MFLFWVGGSIKATGERNNFWDNNLNLISRKQENTLLNTVTTLCANKPGGLLRGTLECGPPYFVGTSESKTSLQQWICMFQEPTCTIDHTELRMKHLLKFEAFGTYRLPCVSCKPLPDWKKNKGATAQPSSVEGFFTHIIVQLVKVYPKPYFP